MAAKERDQLNAVDVLIVGAGPAGLTCALGLKRAGVNVRIIDQRCVHATVGPLMLLTFSSSPDKVATGHADGVMPRTIEILQVF